MYDRHSDSSSEVHFEAGSRAGHSEESNAQCRFDRHSAGDVSTLLCAAEVSPTVYLRDCSPSVRGIGRLIEIDEVHNDSKRSLSKCRKAPSDAGVSADVDSAIDSGTESTSDEEGGASGRKAKGYLWVHRGCYSCDA